MPLPIPPPIPTGPDTRWGPDGPIGGIGKQPPPTLEGIARKLGQMNDEIDALLNREPGSGGGGPVDLSEILDLLQQLLPTTQPGGSYSLERVCERGPDGDVLPPLQVTFQGANSEAAAILARLNAIAELISKSKTIRQPTCALTREGTPATVTFT